jgi:hypothetical protein
MPDAAASLHSCAARTSDSRNDKRRDAEPKSPVAVRRRRKEQADNDQSPDGRDAVPEPPVPYCGREDLWQKGRREVPKVFQRGRGIKGGSEREATPGAGHAMPSQGA